MRHALCAGMEDRIKGTGEPCGDWVVFFAFSSGIFFVLPTYLSLGT